MVPSPSIDRVDDALVVADVGGRPDGHLRRAVGRDLDLHDVGRGAGDVGGEADGLEEVVAVQLDARRVGRRQDLLVVRELAVDEAADQVDALDVEEDLVLLGGEDDLDRVVRVGRARAPAPRTSGRARRRSSPRRRRGPAIVVIAIR